MRPRKNPEPRVGHQHPNPGHEIAELPSGDFLTFTSEVRTFDDYPSSTDDPDAPRVTQEIVGDVIIEVARDGTIARRPAPQSFTSLTN